MNRLALMPVMIVLVAGCVQYDTDAEIEAKIRQNLIGMELNYSSITGEVTSFLINESDIKAVQKITVNGSVTWKAEIGDTPLQWIIYFDKNGNNVIRIEQTFQA